MADKDNIELGKKAKEISDALLSNSKGLEESQRELMQLKIESLKIDVESRDLSKSVSAELSRQQSLERGHHDLARRYIKEMIVSRKAIQSADMASLENVRRREILDDSRVELGENIFDIEQKKLALEQQQISTSRRLAIDAFARNQEAARRNLFAAKVARDMVSSLKQQATILKTIDEFGGKMSENYKNIKGLVMDIASGGMSAIISILRVSIDRFIELDKAAEDFRKNTGLTINQMSGIRAQSEQLNIQFQQMGISIEKAYAAGAAIANVFGNASAVSADMQKTVALLAVNLGVAEEDSANVMQNFMGMGNYSEGASKSIIALGAHLSKAAHIPFNKVMKDVANTSSTTSAVLGSNPAKLMSAAIAARVLGVNLETVAETAHKLLDFSSSINAEMDASALLGRNVNFQYARQLAFQGKTTEMAQEALRVVKEAGNWEEMTFYQRQALAKASGMEVKDLTRIMALEKIRNSGGADAKKLKIIEAQQKALKGLLGTENQQLVMQAEQELMDQQMQGRMTNLNNAIKSIMISLGTLLEPVVRILADVVVPLLTHMAYPLQKVAELVAKLGSLWEDVSGGMKEADSEAWKIGKSIAAWSVAILLFRKNFLGLKGLFSGIGSLIASPFKALGGAVGKVFGGAGGASGGVMKGIADGIKKFAGPTMLSAATNIGLLTLSFIGFAGAMKILGTMTAGDLGVATAGLLAFIGAISLAVITLPSLIAASTAIDGAAAVLLPAIGIIALFGAALVPLAYASKLAGEGMMKLGEGLMLAVNPIISIAGIGLKLALAAAGIYSLGSAVSAFAGGMNSISGQLTGADGLITQLTSLSSLGDGLTKTATALDKIASALVKIKGVGQVDVSFLSKAVSPATVPAPLNNVNDIGYNEALLAEFKKFTKLIQDGGVAVYLDKRLVSQTIAG